MRKGLFLTVLLLIIFAALPVQAGLFVYDIPVQQDQLEVRPDGRVSLLRYFEFRVDKSSQDAGTEIWAGLPTGSTIVTSVRDEQGINIPFGTRFGGSNYVVTLTGFSIKPGESKQFYIEAEIPQFIYPDSRNEGYVTLEYTPGWWTEVPVAKQEIAVMLPPGVTKDEVRTGLREWDGYTETEDGRGVVYFEDQLEPNERLTINIGFPAKHLNVVIPGPTTPITPSYPERVYPSPGYYPGYQTGPGPEAIIGLFFIGIFVMFLFSALSGRQDYKAPFAAMEGVGINTDLSPIEAAVLLRMEPRKVLTLALFELLRDKYVKVEYENPLRFAKYYPDDLSGFKLCMFEAIKDDGTFDQGRLLDCFKELVQSVIDKTKPYCRKETEAYYKGKVADNWERLKEAKDAGEAFSSFDDALFWLLLDEQFQEKIEQTLPREWQVFPHHYWLWMHFSPYSGTYYWPHLFRTFGNVGMQVWDNQDRFSDVQTQLFRPIVVPPASSSSSRGGGGGGFSGPSCACACACVSCACACACAGGGGCT